MNLNGYETFCLYLAIKNHFTQTSYDFFKYNGKTNVSKESFLSRRDRFQFEKLARKYDEKELRSFLIAQMLAGNNWVGDMLTPDAEQVYKAKQGILQSLTYTFANDLSELVSGVETPKEIFDVKPDQLPYIIEKWMSGDIVFETVVILNDIANFVPKYDRILGKDFYIWEDTRNRILKYSPFLEYDKSKILKIMKEKLQ